MSVIALASAKGAPGVTTTALALTLHWPRPVLLVEADLAGPSIFSGFFRGQVAHDRGLGPLAIAHSHGTFEEAVAAEAIQLVDGSSDKRFLAGIPGPHAGPSVFNLWPDLTTYLIELERGGVDVIVDLGRISAVHDDRDTLIRRADQVLLVTSSRLPDIAVARDVVGAYVDTHDDVTKDLTNFAVLTIGPGRPYDAREIARNLALPNAGTIAWDPLTAQVLSDGTTATRKYATSPLIRSIAPTIDTITMRVAQRRARFATTSKDHR